MFGASLTSNAQGAASAVAARQRIKHLLSQARAAQAAHDRAKALGLKKLAAQHLGKAKAYAAMAKQLESALVGGSISTGIEGVRHRPTTVASMLNKKPGWFHITSHQPVVKRGMIVRPTPAIDPMILAAFPRKKGETVAAWQARALREVAKRRAQARVTPAMPGAPSAPAFQPSPMSLPAGMTLPPAADPSVTPESVTEPTDMTTAPTVDPTVLDEPWYKKPANLLVGALVAGGVYYAYKRGKRKGMKLPVIFHAPKSH